MCCSRRLLIREFTLPSATQCRVGDWLLSVNKHAPKSAAHANEVIKSLPRGPVHVVAMAPPSNISSLSEGAGPQPLAKPAPLPPPGRKSVSEVPPVPPPVGPEAPPPRPTGEQALLTAGEPVSTEEEKVIEVEVSGRTTFLTLDEALLCDYLSKLTPELQCLQMPTLLPLVDFSFRCCLSLSPPTDYSPGASPWYHDPGWQ